MDSDELSVLTLKASRVVAPDRVRLDSSPQSQSSDELTLSRLAIGQPSPSQSPVFNARPASPPSDRSASPPTTPVFMPSTVSALSRRRQRNSYLSSEVRPRAESRRHRIPSAASLSTEDISEPFVVPHPDSSPFPHPTPPASSGLVSRITNAISSFSTVLLPPSDHTPPQTPNPIVHPRPTQHAPPMRPRLIAILDSVSTEVDTQCSICLEPQRSMRRLEVCGHMFCADCLMAQMKSKMVRRYDCALCRRSLLAFRRPGALW
ncbi:hypothetical protein IAQ61_007780 [Plenodomus lingam]|nr:hypothetical protein IAQ61_007780 [Plenodomus lingam]